MFFLKPAFLTILIIMSMVLKTNLLGSSNPFFFQYLMYIAILASCRESKTKNLENSAHHAAFINMHQKAIFNPDSTVNNILILGNRLSSIKFYPSIDKLNLISC